MEYVYAAMLLHKAGKKIDEGSVKKVLEAAGIKPGDARIKALVAALEGVNIEEAIKTAAMVAPAAQATTPAESQPQGGEAKKEDKKKEEPKPSAEEAAAGLGALFG